MGLPSCFPYISSHTHSNRYGGPDHPHFYWDFGHEDDENELVTTHLYMNVFLVDSNCAYQQERNYDLICTVLA